MYEQPASRGTVGGTSYESDTGGQGSSGATAYESLGPDPVGVPFLRFQLPPPILEDYAYERTLSTRGGQADVVLVRHRVTGRQQAIKWYREGAEGLDIQVVEQVRRADPAHVAPILEVRTWQHETWEVQEYFPHGSLADVIRAYPAGVPAILAREILDELTAALAHIHGMHLVHRDLKPENVLVRNIGPMDLVLADFGMSRHQAASRVVRSIAGSFPYMAPEAGDGMTGRAGDWWSLGVILHELLTGRHLLADPATGHLPDDAHARVAIGTGDYTIAGLPDDRWELLVRGLLTPQASHRWGSEQIRQWVAGATPPVYTNPVTGAGATNPEFALGESTVTSPAELAAVLRESRYAGEDLLADPRRTDLLLEWLHPHNLEEPTRRVLASTTDPGVKSVRLQALLDPTIAPRLRGVDLDATGLTSVADRAASGDTDAAAWIRSARTNNVFSWYARQVPGMTSLAQADQRLDTWWKRMTAQAGWLGGSTALNQPALEGHLLKAALSPQARNTIHAETLRTLATAPSLPADFTAHLDELARDDPDNLGSLLLATTRIPEERSRQLNIQRAEEQRQATERRQREEADKQRDRDRRAQIQAANRTARGKDISAFLLAIAACVTVLIPWLIGHLLLGTSRAPGPGVFDTTARRKGNYFLTDWTLGCAVVGVVAVAYVLLRPWRGRAATLVTAGAAGAAIAAVLVPYSNRQWALAEAGTARTLITQPYPFNDHFYSCGSAAIRSKNGGTTRIYTLFTGRTKGSNVNGCNRFELFDGWRRIALVSTTGVIPPIEAFRSHVESQPGKTVGTSKFTVEYNNGKKQSWTIDQLRKKHSVTGQPRTS